MIKRIRQKEEVYTTNDNMKFKTNLKDGNKRNGHDLVYVFQLEVTVNSEFDLWNNHDKILIKKEISYVLPLSYILWQCKIHFVFQCKWT